MLACTKFAVKFKKKTTWNYILGIVEFKNRGERVIN